MQKRRDKKKAEREAFLALLPEPPEPKPHPKSRRYPVKKKAVRIVQKRKKSEAGIWVCVYCAEHFVILDSLASHMIQIDGGMQLCPRIQVEGAESLLPPLEFNS